MFCRRNEQKVSLARRRVSGAFKGFGERALLTLRLCEEFYVMSRAGTSRPLGDCYRFVAVRLWRMCPHRFPMLGKTRRKISAMRWAMTIPMRSRERSLHPAFRSGVTFWRISVAAAKKVSPARTAMLRFWVVRFHSHERAVNRVSSPKRIMCPIPCASSVVSFFALLGGGSLGFAFWTSTGTGGGAGAFVMRCGDSQVVFMAWFRMF